MSNIKITLDVSKINKSKIVERKYTNKDGQEVCVKEYKTELVELREPKLIKDGGTWKLMKTHFLVEEQTKQEKADKVKNVFVGDGFTFTTTGANIETGAEIAPDDIPF